MKKKSSAARQQALSLGVLFNADAPAQERILAGIESFAAEKNINLYLFDTAVCTEPGSGPAAQNALSNLVNKRLVRGLVILPDAFPSSGTRPRTQTYKRFHPLPLVTAGCALPGLPHILPDMAAGLTALVGHLAKAHQRRRIGFISGPAGRPDTRELLHGWETALKHSGLPFRKNLVVAGNLTYESGRRAALKLCVTGRTACDAVVAANDYMAAGALEELIHRGVRVPEDCSVVGLANEEVSAVSVLPLTTVDTGLEEIGRQAAEKLFRLIHGETVRRTVKVSTRPLIRSSCGCLLPGDGFPLDALAGTTAPYRPAAPPSPDRGRASRRLSREIAGLYPAFPAGSRSVLETLLKAVLVHLPTGGDVSRSALFLKAWQSLLAGLSVEGQPLRPWLDVLDVLCGRPSRRGAAFPTRAHQAVLDFELRMDALHRCLIPRHGRLLEDAVRELTLARDMEGIRRVILNAFPRLGYTGCFLSVHAGEREPLHYSRLAAGYSGKQTIAAGRYKAPFLTNRLLPAGLAERARRRTYFVEPLFHGKQFLGLLLLRGGRLDPAVNGTLRRNVRDALERTARLKTLVEEKKNLQAQITQQAKTLLDAGQKLQKEKRSQEKLKDELQKSETRYRRWFEEDFTGNFIASANGDIINCNSAFARMFGFQSIAEAQGANFGDFYPNKSALEDFYTLLGVVKRIAYYESEFVRKDGSLLHIIGNIIGTFDSDHNLVEMQGFLFDNTDRKRLEDELRHAHKMDAIGRLAGGIAHDFNNILTGIMGYSELLLHKIPKSDPSQHDVEEIKKAAKSAASLTRQLLAFSRKQLLKPLLLDLNDVVSNMRDLLIRIIGEHIALVTELDPELKPVKADRGQIEQVIMNLVINARDALLHGGTVVVTTRNKSIDNSAEFASSVDIKPGPYVVLEVTDNGVGMDLETQSHIFEPFFSTKKMGQGVGLGLSTVYGIITQSGGFPEVMSEPHRGTTLRIYLPQYLHAGEIREERVQYQEEVRGNETILLVEDENFVRELAEKVLSNEGYHVIAAHNAQEALSLIKKHTLSIDLVVTDVVMPGISGVELGQKIQAFRPEVRVLYMSGYDDKMLRQQGELGHKLNFIQKPFTPETFLRWVQEALNR